MFQVSAKLPQIRSQFIAISGGMDLTTSPIAKASSEAIVAMNVQPNYGGGFSRIEGYECIDGKTIPSEMGVCELIADMDISENLKGKTFELSGASYRIIRQDNKKLVIASMLPINFSVPNKFMIDSQTYRIVSVNRLMAKEIETLQAYQAESFQIGVDSVMPVPGENPLRGVVEFDREIIAFRDQGGQCGVFVSSRDGWQVAPKTYLVELKNITKPKDLIEGIEFIAGGKKGVIYSVALAPDDSGGFIVSNIPLNAEQSVQIASVTAATVKSGSEVKLSKGKNWQFIYHNFYGSAHTGYAYGCNGEQVIEIRSGGIVVPIAVNGDNPICICAHKNHLFAAFPGGQLGHSLVGYPHRWSTLLGAEQFGIGDQITALSSVAGNVLLIGCENKTVALYGTGSADWVLKEISKIGIHANTLQSVFIPIAITSNGITRVDQTEQFGDFRISEIDANRKLNFNPSTTQILFSSTKPNANQVRFYSANNRNFCIMLLPDGSTRSTYFNYPDELHGVWQSPRTVFLAFGDDGKVYRQSEQCYSFAGKPIDWSIKMAFNHCGSPMLITSWHSAELQATTNGVDKLFYRFDLDYNSNKHAANLNKALHIAGGGGRWNDSLWNDFLWSAEDYSAPTFHLKGHSRNISLSFSGTSIYSPQFEISGIVLNYIPRRNHRV